MKSYIVVAFFVLFAVAVMADDEERGFGMFAVNFYDVFLKVQKHGLAVFRFFTSFLRRLLFAKRNEAKNI